MTIDFDKIREENITAYGTETSHLELLSNLYSDRTHFIYELLQNAEDAGAREVEFHLYEDRLELRHDGRPFDDADVRGVCAIGKGTKKEDVTKIGRFGVGFKSVYAFTASPTIHSGDNHFRIEMFVRPFEVDPVQLASRETLIRLQFDRDDVAPSEAVDETDRGLTELNDWSLLFLNNVKKVTYLDHLNDWTLEHIRTLRSEGDHRRVTINISRNGDEPEVENWWVWSRRLDTIGIVGRAVEFAVPVEREGGQGRYEPFQLIDPPLVVFFPTQKESHLGFLLQAPFRTTPARDNIPQRDEANRAIVDEAGQLLIEVVKSLRDRDLLTEDFLESLPLEPEHFPEGSMLRPLHLAIVQAFREESLVPVVSGGHRPAASVALGRTAGVRGLLSDTQMEDLFGGTFDWVAPAVGDAFRAFLREVLGVAEHTPERVVGSMTKGFLEAQEIEWIDRFYEFLGSVPNLSQRPRHSQPGIALRTPVLRIDDGTHQLPQNQDGSPTAYLPSDVETELPKVDARAIESQAARDYLTKGLGLREPDVVAELTRIVIPNYRGQSLKQLDREQHLRHMELVLDALESDARGLDDLHDALAETPFIVGVAPTTGRQRLCTLDELTMPNPDTELMLGDEPETRFVDIDFYGELAARMDPLRVRRGLKPQFRKASWRDYVVVHSRWGDHKRGLSRFDPDAACPILEHGLDNPTAERAVWIWAHIALPFRYLIRGLVETSSRQDYTSAEKKTQVSPFGQLLRGKAWLPSGDGFVQPSELELEDLPEDFERDGQLAEALGMKKGVLRELSIEAGIPSDILQELADEDVQAEWRVFLASRGKEAEGGNASEEEHFDPKRFTEELSAALDRPGATTGDEPERIAGTVSNPALRRERVAGQLDDDRANSRAVRDRFKVVPRKAWERKRNETRDALVELYGGHCQICEEGFRKANGDPYFEGLYLVSYTNAEWIDRLGNVLSLCADCSARFQHAEVEADGFIEAVAAWRAESEGGDGPPEFPLHLAGEERLLRFKERHILDLQMMLASDG
jgi:hypothetical protein